MNAAMEKHCGGCGIHLASQAQQVETAIQSQFEQIAQIEAESRHSEAIDRLLALDIAEHSRLLKYREQIGEKVAALRALIVRLDSERDAAIATGRDLLGKYDYEKAALVLEQVPAPYRTDEHRELLELVRTRQVEMLTLLADIRRSLSEKRTDGLLEKVEELLRLKPDHAQVGALAQKLRPAENKRRLAAREELYKSATASLAGHDYAGALQLLEQIHPAVLTPRLVKLIDEAKANAAEASWLTRDLREAVAYDEHLHAIAERLLKLQPDQQDTNVVQRLRAIAKVNGSTPTKPQAWPLAPATSFWGPPLETITRFRRIDTSSLKDAVFHDAPDRFCVAAGLALQGLEKHFVNVNLVPPEKSNLLRGLFRKKKASVWGIDVGRAALKAMRLAYDDENDRVVAETAVYLEHTSLLNAPETQSGSVLRETLGRFFERNELKDALLCVSVPGHKVFYRALALPLVDEKKLAELMKFEIRQLIPFPLDEVVWGYQMLGSRRTDSAYVSECEVAVLALKLEEARAAIAPFTERGLKVEVLNSDAAALFNFICFEQVQTYAPREKDLAVSSQSEPPLGADSSISEQPNSTDDDVTVLLDVGTDSSNLIVTTSRALVVRPIPLGGNSFSRAMVKEFRLTFTQAEKVKRNPTSVRELHRLYAVIQPRVADLVHVVHRTIDSFLQSNPARRVSRFVVVGGGLKMHGALRLLWHGDERST
jgi:type IV pilus assembly protein PilM